MTGPKQSLAHVALIVRDYDEAIGWFTDKLGFTLVADAGKGLRFPLAIANRRP